jgi:hypothetical protein
MSAAAVEEKVRTPEDLQATRLEVRIDIVLYYIIVPLWITFIITVLFIAFQG